MLRFADASRGDILDVLDRLRIRLRSAATLEGAAREVTQALYEDFGDNVVLVRMFLTLPFARLPDDLRRAAWQVVEAQGLQADMRETTPVLTLLGTSGRRPEWCDRRCSHGHAAIPLCSRVFVDSIPMLARMLQEMGIEVGLSIADDPYLAGSGWVGQFHVEDARTARDEQGRRIIPAADFVETHGVRSVFGLGKAYADGSIASLVVFTNTLVSAQRVTALSAIANGFKAESVHLVANGLIFDPT